MIALYCRVSTDEQAEHGFSIENQKERLAAYCLSQGWDDFRYYIDDGYTGTNTDRPALQRLIRHINEGKIKTVLVYKLDRLGRKQKDVLHLLEDVFDANGVSFKSATEPFDTGTPLGKAMLGILAVFAQLERDTIVERTTSGRRQRVSKGMWYGGRVPFGYEWNKDAQQLEVIPEEAALVTEAFSMYLKGHSLLYIADWLSSRTTARVFDHSVVRDMLQRPIYVGRLPNAGNLVDGRHAAIVDIETFDRVQNEMAKRKDGRPPMGDYLLSGLLRCGVCGGPVIHTISKRGKYKYDYYACKAQHIRRRDRNNDCSLGYHRMEVFDSLVINRLRELALNPNDVEAELKQRSTVQEGQERLIADLNAKLDGIESKLERWYDAFEQGLINPGQLRDRISALEEEKKALQLRLEEISDSQVEERTDELIATLETIGEAWDYMTFDEQKAVLRAAVDHIILYPDRDPEFVWNV
jgi:site-specific DNA recombinase